MELVNPGIGLIFWMTLAFGIVLWVLAKYAWKPILQSLKEREESIDKAIHEADQARKEMKQLRFSNEQLMAEAKEERDDLLKQARELKEKLIEDARKKANEESNRIIESARETIENEKNAAMVDLKNQIAGLSIEIAEKVIGREMEDRGKQKEYIDQLIKKADLN
jgi:F-type H+-transporting ATPase subunit b